MKTNTVLLRSHQLSSVVIVFLLLSVGCGGTNKSKVSGTITRTDGTPVKGATIMVRSNETGKSANGRTNNKGYYELGAMKKGDGIEPGDYYVIISEDRGGYDSSRPRSFSSKYERAGTSGLQLQVKPGENEVFDLVLDMR